MKYNRNYALFIEQNNRTDLKITPPFTLEFEVHRNSFSSANVASFRLFNLNENSRTQIRKDATDIGNIREISFSAGYGDKLLLGFTGNISQAWSVREGTSYVTQIECFDGGYAYVNATANIEFPAGTRKISMVQALAKSLPGVKFGAIGNIPGEISRGNSLSGNSVNILQEITDGKFFIDNGKANVLSSNEAIEAPVFMIDSESGLLGTPLREESYINLEMLFEPGIQVGQLVELRSKTSTHFNGIHRVMSLRHKGTISGAIAGSCTTSVGLLPGQFAPVRSGT